MKGLLFTYALTYGGAVVSIFNPWYGLLIYFCFAIVRPESLWYWSVRPGQYSRILAIALLIGWALQRFGRWPCKQARPTTWLLCAYWCWLLLCTAYSPDFDASRDFLIAQAKIILPFFVGTTLIDSSHKLKQLAWVIVASQGYVAFELNRDFYVGFNRLQMAGFGGLDNNGVSVAMVTCAGLAFFLGNHETSIWRKLTAYLCAALMVHVPMFSGSRGGMLGAVILGCVTFAVMKKERKTIATFAAAVVVGAALAGPPVIERFATIFSNETERDDSAQSRLALWGDCWKAMKRSPVVGVGPSRWRDVAYTYGWPPGKDVHSTWLRTGVESGFPGMLFFSGFFGLAAVQCWRYVRQCDDDDDSWLPDAARGTTAGLSAFVVSASFVSLEGLEVAFYLALLGIMACACGDTDEDDNPPNHFPSDDRAVPSAE